MKHVTFYLMIFLFGISILSCKQNQTEGIWDDNIKLSRKTVNVDANANSIIISTQSTSWWLNHISLNKQEVDISNINKHAQNVIVNGPDFKIERKEGNEIIISLNKNDSKSERILNIGLQSGNYFDGIVITQAK